MCFENRVTAGVTLEQGGPPIPHDWRPHQMERFGPRQVKRGDTEDPRRRQTPGGQAEGPGAGPPIRVLRRNRPANTLDFEPPVIRHISVCGASSAGARKLTQQGSSGPGSPWSPGWESCPHRCWGVKTVSRQAGTDTAMQVHSAGGGFRTKISHPSSAGLGFPVCTVWGVGWDTSKAASKICISHNVKTDCGGARYASPHAVASPAQTDGRNNLK